MKIYSPWIPNQPTSKGATAYHNAVVDTSWHKNNIYELINHLKNKIKKDQIIVDFGAGTGSSTIYLSKAFKNVRILAVDNSASWLTKAYEILHKNKNIDFLLIEKEGNKFISINKLIGKNSADHILSFNTVHLIPDIQGTFDGIFSALKKGGTFAFQSGNIFLQNKEEGIMKIDDSINSIHDISIEIINQDTKYKKYKRGLKKKVKDQTLQRKLIFPQPRTLEFYLKTLKTLGFKNKKIFRKRIRVKYKNWLDFLKVKRLQAGILPEIGGRNASEKEVIDRNLIITKASKILFSDLNKNNSLATSSSFCAEWVYVLTEK